MANTINDVRNKLSDKNKRKAKRNAKYWSERMAQVAESTYADSEKCVNLANKNYARASAQITKDIESWYMRIAKNNSVSLADARQMLDKNELKDFKMTLEEYIEKGKNNIDGRFAKELENASAKVHIRRDEALQLELKNTIENMYGKNQAEIQKSLGQTYENSFYHTAYELDMNSRIDASVVGLNKRAISKAIDEPWRVDSTKWSDNIWQNKEDLIQNIQTHLTQGLMRGDHPEKVAKDMSKLMGSDYKKTARLVRTETAAILNKAQLDCYKDLGMDQIQICETLDSTTCDLCGQFDMTVIDCKEAVAGVTIPPFHPNCRGCTAPYDEDWLDEGDTRIARDEDGNEYYVPADTSYKDWKARFVDKTKSNDDLKQVERPLAVRGGNILGIPTKNAENIPNNVMQELDKTMNALNKEFPSLSGKINDILFTEDIGNDIARASINKENLTLTLKLNKSIFSNENAIEMLGNSASSLTEKDGLKGYLKHEYTHFREYQIAISQNTIDGILDKAKAIEEIEHSTYAYDVLIKALNNCGLTYSQDIIEHYISEYASKNPSEAIAEAYSNSKTDSVLCEEIKKILARKWGIKK